jgi:hypothetical protein
MNKSKISKILYFGKLKRKKRKKKTKSIKSSNWARRLKRGLGNGSSYLEGISIAERLASGEITHVFLNYNNENGEWVWSIQPFVVFGNLGEYWLDAFPTKKEAIACCREMGWRIKK